MDGYRLELAVSTNARSTVSLLKADDFGKPKISSIAVRKTRAGRLAICYLAEDLGGIVIALASDNQRADSRFSAANHCNRHEIRTFLGRNPSHEIGALFFTHSFVGHRSGSGNCATRYRRTAR